MPLFCVVGELPGQEDEVCCVCYDLCVAIQIAEAVQAHYKTEFDVHLCEEATFESHGFIIGRKVTRTVKGK